MRTIWDFLDLHTVGQATKVRSCFGEITRANCAPE
jgi:hypothetical protein